MKPTLARPTAVLSSPSILFFLCLNDRGGAEISTLKLAQGLRLSGRSVVCAVYGTQPMLARDLGFDGEIIDFGTTRTWATLVPLFRLLRQRRFSAVISALTHTNFAAIIAAFLAGNTSPVIATEHGVDGIEACAHSRFFTCVTRLIYARAAALVAVSQGLAQQWRDLLPSKPIIQTIYNPVVPDNHGAVPPPAHAWLADKTIPVVIGIGRLKKEKNFSFLLRGFAQAAEKRPLRLVIIGEGEQRAALEQLARELGVQDKVLMPGFAAAPRAWLAHASLLVCPSEKEGFGNVIVEALACGVPVVSSDCPFGPAEILENGKYGRLVPVNHIDALADAITRQILAQPDAQMLRARAQGFTVARSIDGYAALVDNLSLAWKSPMHAVSPDATCSRWRCFFRWLRSVFFYEHWMVGIVDQPIGNALTWGAAPPARWIEPFGKKRYLADPFPWPGSADTILCEDYDNAARLGRISVLKLNANGIADEVKTYFPVACHLSFPFLFMQDDQVFAMPESCAAKRLEIFRWHEQDGIWVSHTVIFTDKAVADAALYRKDGLFWISYTDVTHDPHDNLHLIYAENLTGPWTLHPANPVRRGHAVSRNGGGVFAVNGKLYRPAQDCSEIYGGALRIMEITDWTVTNYQEKEVAHIAPSSPDYPDGFHTLVAWGDNKCLVDGMRLTFSLHLLWDKIKRRLKR